MVYERGKQQNNKGECRNILIDEGLKAKTVLHNSVHINKLWWQIKIKLQYDAIIHYFLTSSVKWPLKVLSINIPCFVNNTLGIQFQTTCIIHPLVWHGYYPSRYLRLRQSSSVQYYIWVILCFQLSFLSLLWCVLWQQILFPCLWWCQWMAYWNTLNILTLPQSMMVTSCSVPI